MRQINVEEGVGTALAPKLVRPRAPHQGIGTRTAQQSVVAAIADHVIVTRNAGDGLGGTGSNNHVPGNTTRQISIQSEDATIGQFERLDGGPRARDRPKQICLTNVIPIGVVAPGADEEVVTVQGDGGAEFVHVRGCRIIERGQEVPGDRVEQMRLPDIVPNAAIRYFADEDVVAVDGNGKTKTIGTNGGVWLIEGVQ